MSFVNQDYMLPLKSIEVLPNKEGLKLVFYNGIPQNDFNPEEYWNHEVEIFFDKKLVNKTFKLIQPYCKKLSDYPLSIEESENKDLQIWDDDELIVELKPASFEEKSTQYTKDDWISVTEKHCSRNELQFQLAEKDKWTARKFFERFGSVLEKEIENKSKIIEFKKLDKSSEKAKNVKFLNVLKEMLNEFIGPY